MLYSFYKCYITTDLEAVGAPLRVLKQCKGVAAVVVKWLCNLDWKQYDQMFVTVWATFKACGDSLFGLNRPDFYDIFAKFLNGSKSLIWK